MGFYKNKSARIIFGIYQECFKHLNNPNALEKVFNDYSRIIFTTGDSRVFTDTTDEGFNCIMDTLSYPAIGYLVKDQNEQIKAAALEVGHRAFTTLHDVLSKKPSINKQDIVRLLIARNYLEMNSFHIALVYARQDTFESYLHIIDEYYDSRALSYEQYKTLLIQCDSNGGTPLSSAVYREDAKKLTSYLKIAERRLSSTSLIEALSLPNNSGYSPLHFAILSNNIEIFEILCVKLAKLHKQGKLSTKRYLTILTAEAEDGRTPLHFIFRNASPEILSVYLQQFSNLLAMRDEKAEPLFTTDRFVDILTKRNLTARTPLHCVKDSKSLSIYLDMLTTLHNTIDSHGNRLLSTERFIITLTAPNHDIIRPLHYLLELGDYANVAAYFHVLNNLHAMKDTVGNPLLSTKVFFTIMESLTNFNFTPVLNAVRGCNNDNLRLYLNTLFMLYSEIGADGQHIISSRECLNVLMKANDIGFTPLHQLFSIGNEALLSTFLEYLQAFQDIEKNITSAESVTPEYIDFLLSRTEHGGTILHCLFSAKNIENCRTCFDILDNFEKEGMLSEERYIELLLSRDASGETPLSLALYTGIPENVSRYLEKIDYFYKNGVLSNQQYSELLLQPNKSGDYPFHNAIYLQHQESFLLYLNTLDQLHRIRVDDDMNRLLSRQDYINIFVTQGCNQNAIQDLANTCNIPFITAVFTHFDKIFDPAEIYEMLREFRCCERGNRQEKDAVNDYFFGKKTQYKAICAERENSRKRVHEEETSSDYSRRETSSYQRNSGTARDRFFLKEPPLKRRMTHTRNMKEF